MWRVRCRRRREDLQEAAVGFAQQNGKGSDGAADIAHAVLLRMLGVDECQSTVRYFRAAVVNKVRGRARLYSRRPECRRDLHLRSHDSSPEEIVIADEVAERLRTAIQRLPPASKFCFQRIDLCGDSVTEVAALRGVSPKAVEMRLAHARRTLRTQLGIG